MIRYSFKAFLVGVLLSFTSVVFAQQKITVLDETSGFPIHDVQVSIIFTDSNFIKGNTKQDKNIIGVKQYFTNKKGKTKSARSGTKQADRLRAKFNRKKSKVQHLSMSNYNTI